jgi:dihydropteroate synthase
MVLQVRPLLMWGASQPGLARVLFPLQEKWSVLRRLSSASARELDVIISVDTSTPVVMTETARLGAGLINDVRSLQPRRRAGGGGGHRVACVSDAYAR